MAIPIMADEINPDEVVLDQQNPEQPNQEEIPDDQVELDEDKYGSTGQQVLAGVEGAAKGVLGPIAPLVETKVLGVNPEDIKGREKANPFTSKAAEIGSFAGSLLTGVGEASLLAKLGEGTAALAGLGEGATLGTKVASAVIKGVAEMSAFQAGEEASKTILHDPEQSVSSALTNIGFSGLLGGGVGGGLALFSAGASKGLKALADSKVGVSTEKFLNDFGDRWKFNTENPDLVDAVTNELSNFHQTTGEAIDDVWGPRGIKDAAIAKLVPQEMTEEISSQTQGIANRLESKLSEMAKDPESYPTRLTKKLQNDANRWMEVATNPQSTPAQTFNATQELKQMLQAYSKFEKSVGPLSAEKDFINVAKELQSGLVKDLENTNVWGDAGDLQKGINKAFSQFIDPQKDFLSKFTSKKLGEKVIDPGKIRTYLGQLGKPNAEIKQSMLKDYIAAAEKFRDQVNHLHAQYGIESPILPASLDATRGTYKGALSEGAQWADKVFHGWAPGFAAKSSQTLVGGEIGYREGGLKGAAVGALSGAMLPHLEKALLKKITSYGVPFALQVLKSGQPRAMAEALEHAQNIQRGATAIEKGIDSLFTGAKLSAVEGTKAALANKDKIKEFVEKGGVNSQIDNEVHFQNKQMEQKPQGFARGGTVKKETNSLESEQFGHFGKVFQEQNTMLNAAKSRVFNYLNTVRPATIQSKLPFDNDRKDPRKEKNYDKAINLAANPLSILESIHKGTLTSQEMSHFIGMWPEVHSHLSKKMTERIIKAQNDNQKPSLKVRQAMSLFLGAPLQSSLSPQNILAAQQVFMSQNQQRAQMGQPVTKNKKNTSTLTKASKSYETPQQASLSRQQASH